MAESVSNQTSDMLNGQNDNGPEYGYNLGSDTYSRRVYRNRSSPRIYSRPASQWKTICKFYKRGNCQYGQRCRFAHIDIPNNENATTDDGNGNVPPAQVPEQPAVVAPVANYAKVDQEAVERSKGKTCGVCFEIVMEKSNDRRFGILPNCAHCFCLGCISRWRQAKQYDVEIKKACPECRVLSDFVCPSRYWAETPDDKKRVINSYKEASAKKPCRHFRQGKGRCPFGNKCFYEHALPDGTKVDVGLPRPRQPRSIGVNFFHQMMIWEPLDDLFSLVGELDDLIDIFSDSEPDDDEDDYGDFLTDDEVSEADYLW